MTGEKWMTSGRARLRARQNRTFAQRASLGRTRKRANRVVEPSSEAKRHPSYNKQNTTALTGAYSAWVDPIARRAVVATVGMEASRKENEINAEYPPGTVVASDQPDRRIREANRWNSIRRPLARLEPGIASSYHPGFLMRQQREESPLLSYQQGRIAPRDMPPMQQPLYRDPRNLANDVEDPRYCLQSHQQSVHEMFPGEQGRYTSPYYDQPQFTVGYNSTPGYLQRKAYYQSHSFESAWGDGFAPPPVVPDDLHPPMIEHSSAPSFWHQTHPLERGGGIEQFRNPPPHLNLHAEREANTEYDLQMDYQHYDNNEFIPPANSGLFYRGPSSVQGGNSNVDVQHTTQYSQGNIPPFALQKSHAVGVPPFSLQNRQSGIPPFASKTMLGDSAVFDPSNLAHNPPIDTNQSDFDDFDPIPPRSTRPLPATTPFPSDHHRRYQPIVANTGGRFVSPDSEFGIPSGQSRRHPFQQTKQQQFLSLREELNVMDGLAPFDEPLQSNEVAATRGIPIFQRRRSDRLPSQVATQQQVFPLQETHNVPSRKQEFKVETNVANTQVANGEHASDAAVKQGPSTNQPKERPESGNEPVKFFQAWKGEPRNDLGRNNATPQNFKNRVAEALAGDKRANNKEAIAKNQTERENIPREKEHCHQGRAECENDSVDGGRRPYGSRLPIRFFNEGIEIDMHGRPLAQTQSSAEAVVPSTTTGDPGVGGSPNSDSLDAVEWNGKSSLWA